MPVTSEKFNAVGGLSVGIPAIDLIDSVGNITSPKATIGNVVADQGWIGNITANGNITAGNIIGNIVGNLTGNIRAPGADTQVMFNIGGNLAASANLTFNPSTSFLDVNGNLCVADTACANFFSGDGSNLTNVAAVTANTVVANIQPNIFQLPNVTDISISNSANFSNNSVIHVYGGNSGDILVTDGGGNLAWREGSAAVANGTSRISIPVFSNSILFSAGPKANMLIINPPSGNSPGGNIIANCEIWVDGNIRANYFDGNGARLASINAANIVGTLPDITTTGNIVVGNTTIGSISISPVYGNVSLFNMPSTMTAAVFSIVGKDTVTGDRTFLNMSVVTDGVSVNSDIYGKVDLAGGAGNATAAIVAGNLVITGEPATITNLTGWTVNYTLMI